MDVVVCPSIEAVVASLNVVVGSNGQHEDGPAEGGHIVLVTQVSLRRWNKGGISAGRKGRAISIRMFLYVGLSVR